MKKGFYFKKSTYRHAITKRSSPMRSPLFGRIQNKTSTCTGEDGTTVRRKNQFLVCPKPGSLWFSRCRQFIYKDFLNSFFWDVFIPTVVFRPCCQTLLSLPLSAVRPYSSFPTQRLWRYDIKRFYWVTFHKALFYLTYRCPVAYIVSLTQLSVRVGWRLQKDRKFSPDGSTRANVTPTFLTLYTISNFKSSAATENPLLPGWWTV